MKKITENLYASNGCFVVHMENNEIMVLYAPKDKNGNSKPYNETAEKPAPSFSHMIIL